MVDFGGHSYCGSSPTVGSTGTETQAFQLLKGSTVVFKNGILKITVPKKAEAPKKVIEIKDNNE